MEEEDIQKLPVSAIESMFNDYNNVFFVASSLSKEIGDKFIAGEGIDECFIPDEEFQCEKYPDSKKKEEIREICLASFGFEPETYLLIDGGHYTNGNGELESMSETKRINLAEITKEGVEKFMGLCEKHDAKTVITTDQYYSEGKYFCSENLLQ